jgi:Domain of unknown function (DUF4252)
MKVQPIKTQRMKIHRTTVILFLMTLTSLADAQAVFPVDTSKLAARADETTTVSLDKNMLRFASKFLNDDNEDRQARHLIENLDGIYVRTFEFKAPGAYTAAELETFRKPFAGPEWSHIVSVHGKEADGDTDIYVDLVDGDVQGMFILAAEPCELTFVHILGPIKPEDLDHLSGNFGIPKRHLSIHQSHKEESR